MDPASSKLLLWLWSLTRDRESSSSEEYNKKQLFINSTRLFHLNKNRLFEGYSHFLSMLLTQLIAAVLSSSHISSYTSQNNTHVNI